MDLCNRSGRGIGAADGRRSTPIEGNCYCSAHYRTFAEFRVCNTEPKFVLFYSRTRARSGCMDYQHLIHDLLVQKERLERAIQELERLASQPPKRRGRKSMGDEERRAVSERMKKYWASRRGSRSQ